MGTDEKEEEKRKRRKGRYMAASGIYGPREGKGEGSSWCPETGVVPERAIVCLQSGMEVAREQIPSSLSLPSIPAHSNSVRNHRISEPF